MQKLSERNTSRNEFVQKYGMVWAFELRVWFSSRRNANRQTNQ